MLTTLRIEPLVDHPQLIPELAALHCAEWEALEPEQTVDVRIRDFEGYRRVGVPSALLALAGRTLVGSVLLVADDLAIRPRLTPWLAGVYVKAAYRRQSIATRLIEAAVDSARSAALGQLYLYTPDHESLYARLGWQRLERCTFHGSEITVMHRAL